MEITNTENQGLTEGHRIAKLFDGNVDGESVCPVKDVLSRFGDKWSMYTVLLLGRNEQLRFNQLKSNIQGISQRMLAVTLRSLEEDGIVSRSIFAEVPPRVVYELTDLGRSLMAQMQHLASWAANHSQEILTARRKYSDKKASPGQ
jgi:DNA-binding HxlR family transcriptional regulator